MAEWIRRLDRLAEAYRRVESDDRRRVETLQEVRELIEERFADVEREEVWQLCMATNHRLLSATRICDTAAWGDSRILRDALAEVMAVNAFSVVLVQFTGGRDPVPEEYDIRHTADYARTLRAVNVHLMDHVLVGGGKNCSLRWERNIAELEMHSDTAQRLREQYLEET